MDASRLAALASALASDCCFLANTNLPVGRMPRIASTQHPKQPAATEHDLPRLGATPARLVQSLVHRKYQVNGEICSAATDPPR
jgi:hypothetical protein